MQHLLTSLNRVHQIIHLGAGRCSEMATYLGLNPTQITLVEGDLPKAEYLQKKHLSAANIHVIPKVIAANVTTVDFYSYNLSDANSTCAPAGLLEHYPGLRLLKKQPIQTSDVCLLLQQQNLQGTNNLLVIDLPGQEADILKALFNSDQLGAFEHLAIYSNQYPLYENEAHLRKSGYNLRQKDADQDPDRPFNLYQINPLHTPLQQTKQQLLDLEKQSNRDQQALTALQQQLQIQQMQIQAESLNWEKLAEERDSLQQQAAEFEQQLQAQQASTQAERQAREQLLAERDSLQQQAAELEQQLQAQQAQTQAESLNWEQLAEERESLQQQASEFEQQLQAQQTITRAERQTNEQLTLERDSLQQQATEFEQQHQAQQASTQAERQVKEQLMLERDSLQQQAAELEQQLQAQRASTQTERQANEQLLAERDSLQQQAAELEQQLQAQQASTQAECQAKEQLGKECDELKAERDSAIHDGQSTLQRLEHIKKEHQEIERILVQQKSHLIETQNKYDALQHKHQLLLAENAQTQQRQQQLDSELLKAQAQIELIKDLMLREPSF